MSYLDRTGEDPDQGSAISAKIIGGEVLIELGVMRNFGSISTDAWASLTLEEADELASDIWRLCRMIRERPSSSPVNPPAKEA